MFGPTTKDEAIQRCRTIALIEGASKASLWQISPEERGYLATSHREGDDQHANFLAVVLEDGTIVEPQEA